MVDSNQNSQLVFLKFWRGDILKFVSVRYRMKVDSVLFVLTKIWI
jgi:hypothetical protein